jgi:hypothetical protein
MFISGDFRGRFRRKNSDSLLVKTMDLSVHVFGVCTLSVAYYVSPVILRFPCIYMH